MLLTLPSELTHEILSNLAGNVATLAACARTCKALYPQSQIILFSRVELHLHTSVLNLDWPQKDYFTKESKLLSILEQRPDLVPYIHNVSIYDLFGGEKLIIADLELNSDVVQDLFGRNESALLLLRLLKHTRSMKLFAYNTRSWKHLDPSIQLAIHDAFLTPDLESIDIYAMASFPVSLLEGCAGTLKHLSINTFPTLRLGSRLNVAQLSRLVVRTLGDKHKGVQPLVWKLVCECSATLKELDFFAYLPHGRTDIKSDGVLSLYDTFDLGRVPALQKLTVRYWLSNVSDTNRQLTLLARLLRTMGGALKLEQLTLHFVIIHSRVPLDPTGPDAWKILDAIIVETAPPSLCKVAVQFESIPDQQRQQAVEMVEEGLSNLKARRILDIQSLSLSPRFIPFSR
ncbi:hypothetical protein DFP72DRAFT_1065452 [Ephemerocybe angulata]|uniref:F-box domain-containing protein n=1 Tax=Ephemerocybe angulata TaxID=980116 RepID=A0A8H6I4A6_9AGAR|nr:hypothetical protein DFP72DRAFT_1065452 [Tulosesus angulatus]